jgi:hypothetical protein
MDSNIFGSGQIFLNITFANASQVYNKLAGAPGTQLRIKDAVLTYRQGEMTNQENSLKYMMMRDPSLVYDMPFIRSQIKSVGNLTPGAGISVSGGKGTASFFISGMLNADLVGMCITAHYIPDGALGYNTGNPYVIADLYNLRVTFAGLTLYYAQNYSNRLFNFQSADSAGSSASTIVRGAEAVDNYPHIINFSRLRSMHWDDHYFNVKKYSAQTFNIEFGVPDDCLTAGTGYLPGLDVRVTMFYNGTIELGQYRTQQRLL